MKPGLIIAAGLIAIASAASAQAPVPQSIEEHMVDDTGRVLGVLRTWHNQISQDQAVIKELQAKLQAVTKERDELKAAQATD